jgi:hypothetical protein
MEHKTFQIERIPQTVMYRIKLSGGGEVPDALKGSWTQRAAAVKAIDSYQDKLERAHQAAIAKRQARAASKSKKTATA